MRVSLRTHIRLVLLLSITAAAVLATKANSAEVSEAQVQPFYKESEQPAGFQCLTGVVTPDEVQLRHELHVQSLKHRQTAERKIKTRQVGNIAVIEDNGGDAIIPANPFNLDFRSLLFTPNRTGGYDVSRESLAFERELGTRLPLGDDAAQVVQFPAGFTFNFFGRPQTSVFVSSNGLLSFGGPNVAPTESLTQFLSRPQIAAFWDDLDPTAGEGVFLFQSAARTTVTWSRVPEFLAPANPQTFQVTLYPDGRIVITYLQMASLDGLVGLSAGPGLPFERVTFASPPIRGRFASIVELFQPVDSVDLIGTSLRFFEEFPDIYDILTTWVNFDTGAGISAFHLGVKNKVAGIARAIQDGSGVFGSSGRMQSFVYMNNVNLWPDDPYHRIFGGNSTNSTISILAQELGHRWLAAARFNDNGVMSNELVGRQLAHWNFFLHAESSKSTASNPISSSVEGNVWRDNGDGTFTSLNNVDGFSPLDQYLMGLRPPEEVPDFFLITDPQTTIARTSGPTQFITVRGTKKPVSIRQIIEAEGPRQPDASNSPKHLRTAFILVTRKGSSPQPGELRKLERIRAEWERYYLEHTDQRGSFDTRLGPDRFIGSIEPSTGATGTEFDAVITGTGLRGVTGVSFGGDGVTATIRGSVTDTTLPVRIKVSGAAPHGERVFTLRTTDGSLDSEGVALNIRNYTVLTNGLSTPRGMAVDSTGSVYVARPLLGSIFSIAPKGELTPFATGLANPVGLAVNSRDELFVAESVGRISKISPQGRPVTVATGLPTPTGLVFDSSDNLFVLNAARSNVVRVAGNGTTEVFATLPAPPVAGGIAIDRQNNLYVSSSGTGQIFRITPNGDVRLHAVLTPSTEGLAVDSRGNLYVGNGFRGRILRIDPDGSVATVHDENAAGIMSLAIDSAGRLHAAGQNGLDLIRFSETIAALPSGRPHIGNVVRSLGAPGATFDAVINGSGLDGASAVSISGQGVSAVIRPGGTNTALPVTISIAADARVGARQVTVTTPKGVTTAGNAPSRQTNSALEILFAVQSPPVITSISPREPAPGQIVIIEGAGFEDTFSEFVNVQFRQPNAKLIFGGAILERTGSRMIVAVPAALTLGPVDVVFARSISPIPESAPFSINISAAPAPPGIVSVSPAKPAPGTTAFVTMSGLPTSGLVSFTLKDGTDIGQVAVNGARGAAAVGKYGERPETRLSQAVPATDSLIRLARDASLHPDLVSYYDRSLTTAGEAVNATIEVPAFNLQRGVLLSLPATLSPGEVEMIARVRIGARTSEPSRPFSVQLTGNPTPPRLHGVTPASGAVGQFAVIAIADGAGLNINGAKNIVTFTQGNSSLKAQSLVTTGLSIVVLAPPGLKPGMAEVRVSANENGPASNPAIFFVREAPAPPEIVFHTPTIVRPGNTLALFTNEATFSLDPDGNKVTFKQLGRDGNTQNFVVTGTALPSIPPQLSVTVPRELVQGAVEITVSSTFAGVQSPPSQPRRLTVAGSFVLNVPIMTRGFSSVANDVLDTTLTLANMSGTPANVIFNRFTSTGALVTSGGTPLERRMEPGEVLSISAPDLFLLNTSAAPVTGWIRVYSDVELKGSYSVRDRNASRLIDSASLPTPSGNDLVLPLSDIQIESGTATLYSLVNPNDEVAIVTLTEYDSSGTVVGSRSLGLGPNASILLRASGSNRRGGFARVRANRSITGVVLIASPERLSIANAIAPGDARTFVLPVFAAGGGFDTEVSLINTAAGPNEVVLAAFDSNNRFAGFTQRTLAANQVLFTSIANVLLQPSPAQTRSGYLLAFSSVPGLAGAAEISVVRGEKVSSTALDFAQTGIRFVFSGIPRATPGGLYAGIALFNPRENQQAAEVRLTVLDREGVQVASKIIRLERGEYLSRFLSGTAAQSAIFDSGIPPGGTVLVDADVPIGAVVLLFSDDLLRLDKVPGT